MYRFGIFWLSLTILFWAGCGSSGSSTDRTDESSVNQELPDGAANRLFAVDAPAECTLDTRKKFVYDVMHDSYLWADESAVIDYEDNSTYPDEQAVLDALRNPKDRFSFMVTQKEYDDFFEAGRNIGYGFYFQVEMTPEGNVTAFDILLVYPGSAADRAGLVRSDKIIGIDSYTIDTVVRDEALFSHYFEGNESVTATFRVEHADGRVDLLEMTRAEYDVKSVILDKVVEIDENIRVGYLLFQSFVGTSEDELREAFGRFREANIDTLVLDLRYNGGGYIYIANQLASLIGGWRSYQRIFNQTVFNTTYSRYNTQTQFIYPQNSLSLPKVYILSTPVTCSASELVINALRAQSVPVDVIQIGERTCGKPYGMYPLYFCSKYLLAVDTKNANADGEGDYVEGLKPECVAEDDITHDFADTNETLFATAIYYMRNNQCPQTSRVRSVSPVRFFPMSEGFRGRYAIY